MYEGGFVGCNENCSVILAQVSIPGNHLFAKVTKKTIKDNTFTGAQSITESATIAFA